MSIFSGEYFHGKIKGITLKKRKNTLFFIKENEFNSEEFNLENSYIAVDVPNIIMHTVETPPINDKNALELIIKNKLSTLVEENVDNYKLLFFKNEALSSKDSYAFNVFLVDKSFIENIFKSDQLKLMELLTASAFSLGAYSVHFPDKYVIHFYGDEKRAIITLSINGVLEYVRYVNTPEYIFSQEDLKNFYYEAFNLSYIYLRQNRSFKADLLILSGNISEDEFLITDIYNFSNLPAVSLNPNYFIRNINKNIFKKHIIPVGNIFLSKEYDIREKEILFFLNFKKISKYMLLFFFALNIIFFGLLLKSFLSYENTYKEFQKTKEMIFLRSRNIIKDFKLSEKDIEYYINYIRILNKEKKYTLSDFVKEIKPVLLIHKFEVFKYKKLSPNTYVINLQSQVYFNSLTALYSFNEKLEKALKYIDRSIKIKNNSKTDLNNKKIKIDITFTKKVM